MDSEGGGVAEPFKLDAYVPDAHSGAVTALRFSPDGSAVASASADKTVKLWLGGAPAAASATLEGHALGVNDVAWSPDGAFLASCSDDATIRVWDAATVRAGEWGVGGRRPRLARGQTAARPPAGLPAAPFAPPHTRARTPNPPARPRARPNL